jgi:hypothetical protein
MMLESRISCLGEVIVRTAFVVAVVLWTSVGLGAQQLEDSFDYTVGSLLSANGWTQIRSGTDIVVTEPSLTFLGYPFAATGHAVQIDVGDHSVMRSFGATTEGSLYFAFLIHPTDAPDDSSRGMVAWIGPTDTSIFNRVVAVKVVKDVTDKIRFGLSTEAGISSTGYDFDLNATYLVVVGYTFNPGVDDDVVTLWIDPDLSAGEPTPAVSVTLSVEPVDLAEFVLTGEDSSAEPPACTVDGVRVVTSWAALGGEAGEVFSDGFENNDTSNWSTASP